VARQLHPTKRKFMGSPEAKMGALWDHESRSSRRKETLIFFAG